ncbi:MaoC family dehydratase [Rummeliibacillus sp. JY-2-4R]
MKFDEFEIGQKYETASYKMNKDEIIQFALQFDPQYMHIDEEEARKSQFKGIIASGLHTISVSFKLWTDLNVLGEDVIAGTGIDNLKFIKPVYPGDVLYVTAEVIKKKIRKENGEVTLLLLSFKNDGELVLKADISALVKN